MTQPPNIPNLPGMGNPPTLQAQLSTVTGRVRIYCDRAVEGLTVEQLCATRGGITNRSASMPGTRPPVDNIITSSSNVSSQSGSATRSNEVGSDGRPGHRHGPQRRLQHGLPRPGEFRRYTRAVAEAVVPRIATMSDVYLAEVQTIRPWGPIPRMEAILHGLIGHGNGHLGRASYARTLFGLEGLPY